MDQPFLGLIHQYYEDPPLDMFSGEDPPLDLFSEEDTPLHLVSGLLKASCRMLWKTPHREGPQEISYQRFMRRLKDMVPENK